VLGFSLGLGDLKEGVCGACCAEGYGLGFGLWLSLSLSHTMGYGLGLDRKNRENLFVELGAKRNTKVVSLCIRSWSIFSEVQIFRTIHMHKCLISFLFRIFELVGNHERP